MIGLSRVSSYGTVSGNTMDTGRFFKAEADKPLPRRPTVSDTGYKP